MITSRPLSQEKRLSDDGQWWWDGERWVPTLSPDGRFRWDGQAWRPVEAGAAPPEGAGACRRSGCDRPATVECAYSDHEGRRCATRWCDEHSHVEFGARYCDRHDEVIRTLSQVAGSVHDFKRPEIGDRTLSLAHLVFEELDPVVRGYLGELFASTAGATVVADKHVRAEFTGIHLNWDRTWGVMTQAGYLSRVTVRVPTGEPPVVKVLVRQKEIFSETPDWIARRLRGEAPQAEDRPAFWSRLIEAIKKGVDRPVSFI